MRQLAEQLDRLDREMPHELPALARNQALLALLRAVGNPSQRAAFRAQLIRRPFGVDPLAEPIELVRANRPAEGGDDASVS